MLWSFSENAIFSRLNKYLQRLGDIKEIFDTANDFSKLDRIEFGGLKGKDHSRTAQDLYRKYQKLFNHWSFIEFEPLEPTDSCNDQFKLAQASYKHSVDSLKRTLAQIMVKAFNEYFTTEHYIKVCYGCVSCK